MTAQAVMVRVRVMQNKRVSTWLPRTIYAVRTYVLDRTGKQRLDAWTKGKHDGLPALVMLPVPYQAP